MDLAGGGRACLTVGNERSRNSRSEIKCQILFSFLSELPYFIIALTDVHVPKGDNYTNISYPLRTGQFGVRIAEGTRSNYENNQQGALYILNSYSKSAVQVSGDVFAHHQEHLTVFTVSGS